MAQHYQVGGLDVLALDDGALRTSIDLVLNFPRDQAQVVTQAAPDGSLVISVNNYVFRRPGAVILVDAASADTMQPTLGKLPANLAAAGIPPDSVTHILLTHLHPDHANGLVGPAGDAVFPNAELLIAAEEYEFWTAPEGSGESDAIKQIRARNQINLAPYRSRTRLVRDGEAVLGCTAIVAPGHSPGHTCWRIETGGQGLLAWGDVVHLASLQIAHPEAALTYDLDPAMATQSRTRILAMAAAERLMVAGAHIDAPGLGIVERHGSGYTFVPV